MTVSRPSFSLPYTHFAMIYIDHEDKIKTYESQSIQEQDTSVFSPKVCQNFLEILGERIGCHRPIDQTIPRRLSRRTSNTYTMSASKERLAEQGFDRDNFNGSVEKMVPLRVGDTNKRNCCVILKAFIKFIEPHKQVKHPYKGGQQTQPKWWPSDVIYKEPDHIPKADRIKLLLHILRKLGGYGITADNLQEIVRDTKRGLKNPCEVEIIYEILRVRKVEELFERREVDANMVAYIMNPSFSIKGNGSTNAASVVMGVPKHKELGLTLVSVETKDLGSVSASALLGSSSMPMPLNFEVADRQDNPDYKMPPEYTNPSL
ncbi:unnamed protein product [Penicillium egyptiacum]|uniref:Subtelomeric hrmA-associated cluster protein AFUB-079030/YDR124W-like helical bundle domain-containing protein n=1 Tax=Penicillium egyptiacum TaxID=1303716 RepID=A0A9W4KL59_9EURO|nr:unnamed protein product [Penicillium egyptiacum]